MQVGTQNVLFYKRFELALVMNFRCCYAMSDYSLVILYQTCFNACTVHLDTVFSQATNAQIHITITEV